MSEIEITVKVKVPEGEYCGTLHDNGGIEDCKYVKESGAWEGNCSIIDTDQSLEYRDFYGESWIYKKNQECKEACEREKVCKTCGNKKELVDIDADIDGIHGVSREPCPDCQPKASK